MPADILSRRHIEINRTKLYVDNLPLRDFDGELYDTYLRAIPTDALTSLKMASPTPPLTTRLDSLKRLLTEASRLETFHYDDRGQGTRFTFTGNERLPAFKELNLRSYDWNHGSDVVLKHWDFSQIQHLKLVDVPMFPFLTSIAFPDLRQLRTLHCEDFSAHLPEKREEATRGLDLLVRQIWALNTLKLTCHTRLFPVVDTLLRHAGSLRMLRLRDHVGFGDEERRCPTLRASDLARLAAHGGGLVHLRALELDMDVALCDDPPLFLRALCAFPRLHSLVLHTQTVLRPLEEEVAPLGTDRDYDAAMGIFAALARGRQSAGAVTWRSVTVNVGGWRHVMVRRMGEAWREQNARGVFAERCFVMERGEGGGMVVREEMAVET
ncbi:Uu.00g109880.m01.CDS01 [Anthostomella pinea]|uniref:Uu.00g109880.m01.CDS01 n=1 Tax=Anthostomella pinea TaxID=933095 RepID=A0AAI8VFR7_9PEZI|nr:Uu.00g109880.m01.CDS01 [Anthostomella pinea]